VISGSTFQMEREAEGFSECSSDYGNAKDFHARWDVLERCS